MSNVDEGVTVKISEELKQFLRKIDSKEFIFPSYLLFILFTLFGIVYVTLGFVLSTRDSNYLLFSLLVMFVSNSLVGWYLMKNCTAMDSSFPSNYIKSCSILPTCLINCLWLFSRSYEGPCTTNLWSCNPSASFNSLPLDTLFYLMLTPIMYLELFPYVSLQAILISWSTVVVSISACIYAFNADNTLVVFAFYIPTSLLFMYKKRNERYRSFLEKETYETRIEEVETQSVKNDKEMKHMLSNVTHDMKTVILFV